MGRLASSAGTIRRGIIAEGAFRITVWRGKGGASGVFLCLAVIYFAFAECRELGLGIDRGKLWRSDAFGKRIAVSGENTCLRNRRLFDWSENEARSGRHCRWVFIRLVANNATAAISSTGDALVSGVAAMMVHRPWLDSSEPLYLVDS